MHPTFFLPHSLFFSRHKNPLKLNFLGYHKHSTRVFDENEEKFSAENWSTRRTLLSSRFLQYQRKQNTGITVKSFVSGDRGRNKMDPTGTQRMERDDSFFFAEYKKFKAIFSSTVAVNQNIVAGATNIFYFVIFLFSLERFFLL